MKDHSGRFSGSFICDVCGNRHGVGTHDRAECAINKIEKLQSKVKLYEEALEGLVHLHMCEQEGIDLPTPEMWIDAVDKASEALQKGKAN